MRYIKLKDDPKKGKDCKKCKNHTSIRGFMATCHVTYTEMRDGQEWLVHEGKDIPRRTAEKCEHYEAATP